MLKRAFTIFIILSLVGFIPLFGQKNGLDIADQSHFPSTWIGKWEGHLNIFFPGMHPRVVAMALEILPRDSANWDWTLIYDVQGQEDRRAYTLQPVSIRQGRWRIDENNGIILGARLFHQTLISVFEVDKQLLIARYSLVGDALHFEIIGSGLEPNKTGGAKTNSEIPDIEAIPEVNWFEAVVFQHAILKKADGHTPDHQQTVPAGEGRPQPAKSGN